MRPALFGSSPLGSPGGLVTPAPPAQPGAGGVYFAPSYFAPTYFAPTYFPDGVTAGGGGGGGGGGTVPANQGAYFAPDYWPGAYFAADYWPGVPGVSNLPPDLLTCLVAYLRSEPTVTSLLTDGFGGGAFGGLGFGGEPKVWTDEAPAQAWPPFVLIDGYKESLPGTTHEDEEVDLTLRIVTDTLGAAVTVGAVVKKAVDTPNINSLSLGRAPFAFRGGAETYVLRDASKPERQSGFAKWGYVYVEDVDYQFFVTPEQ